MKWFEEVDKEQPGVIFSRLRLVRNWDAYAFPSRLPAKVSEEMIRRLEFGLRDIGSLDGKDYHYTLLSELPDLDRKVLREHHVFNSTIAGKKTPVGLILNGEEDTSIVLGGTDHIWIQMLRPGMHLDEMWKACDQLDDYIGERFNYSYDEKYGYLTSFPTNVGTGLRASVIVHLPMLSKGRKFNDLVTEMGCFGAKIRGINGESSENYGSLYEISNQKTLGLSEKEILDMVSRVASQMISQENQVRRLTREKQGISCEDEAYKSYGVLKYARRLTSKDAMIFLSQLMQGVNDGVLKMQEPLSVYRLMLGIHPASLQKNSDRPLGKDELDVARAVYIRSQLPDLK
jgi:protein arginine kinase